MRDGPVPLIAHGAIEYVAGVLFIAAPILLDFESGSATGVSVAVGVLVLVIAATTVGPTGLIPRIPISVHATLDYVLAAVLIASPFLFSFSDESAPTVFFIGLGVVHLLLTIGTRFRPGGGGHEARDQTPGGAPGESDQSPAGEPPPARR